MKKPIYLDYNGTTPIDPRVFTVMREFYESEFGNPSSSHFYGLIPKEAVDNARKQVASLMDASVDEIVFTSGGTESNNHAITGAFDAPNQRGRHIITTQIEHPSVLNVFRRLEQRGAEAFYAPVMKNGIVDVEALTEAVRPETALISVMHANNETGAIQPIEEISEITKKHGILLHVDAAQTLGKIPVRPHELGADLVTIAGHKIYAPKGVGALFIKKGVEIKNFVDGAGQETGLRGGTENVAGIAALGKACEIAALEMERESKTLKVLRNHMEDRLLSEIKEAQVNAHHGKRLPNTLSISFYNLEANKILEGIGLHVAASAGAACHAGTIEVSHVLTAMNVPQDWAKGTIRFSLGRSSTLPEIDSSIEKVIWVCDMLRQN